MKVCFRCQTEKPLTEFWKQGRSKDGHRSECAECSKKAQKTWRLNRPEYVITYNKTYRETHKESLRVNAGAYRAKNRVQNQIRNAKQRAVKANLPFDLDQYVDAILDRFDRGVCELSGLTFQRAAGRHGAFSPSIDRVQPALGYVYTNIRIICWALNAAFGPWGKDVTFAIVRAALAMEESR